MDILIHINWYINVIDTANDIMTPFPTPQPTAPYVCDTFDSWDDFNRDWELIHEERRCLINPRNCFDIERSGNKCPRWNTPPCATLGTYEEGKLDANFKRIFYVGGLYNITLRYDLMVTYNWDWVYNPIIPDEIHNIYVEYGCSNNKIIGLVVNI